MNVHNTQPKTWRFVSFRFVSFRFVSFRFTTQMEELIRVTAERLTVVDDLASQIKQQDRKLETVLAAVQALIRQG